MAKSNEPKLLVDNSNISLDERREMSVRTLMQVEPEYEQFLEGLPDKKRDRIHRSLSHLRTGLHTIAPLTCLGPAKCPFIEHCPIPDRGPNGELELGPLTDYPIYRNCVYEQLYMQQKVFDYVKHFKDLDPNNPVEMALINDLAIIDLYKNRAMLIMSSGDMDGDGRDFMKKDIMQQQGEHGTLSSTQTQLHPAAVYIDNLEKRRDRILNALVETRKSKADMAAKMGNTKVDSAIRDELMAVRKALEAATSGTTVVKEDIPLFIDED